LLTVLTYCQIFWCSIAAVVQWCS